MYVFNWIFFFFSFQEKSGQKRHYKKGQSLEWQCSTIMKTVILRCLATTFQSQTQWSRFASFFFNLFSFICCQSNDLHFISSLPMCFAWSCDPASVLAQIGSISLGLINAKPSFALLWNCTLSLIIFSCIMGHLFQKLGVTDMTAKCVFDLSI